MAVRYTLRYRPASETDPNPNAWTEITNLTSTSQAVTGLTAGTRYEVEVVAVSDGGVQSTPVSGSRWTLFGQPSAPSTTPAGYALSSDDTGTNGSIDVSWTAVAGATSYTVSHRETGQGDGAWVEVTGLSGTSTRLEGLDGAKSHEVRVAVVNGDGVASTPSTETTGASAVATGGTVTSFVGNGIIGVDGTRYVVHEFATAGLGTLTLLREREISYLVVGGGGGGGGDGGGGGGGGALLESTHSFNTAADVQLSVGAGGTGGAWSGDAATHGAASTITLDGIPHTAPGGLAGSGGPSGGGGLGGSGGSASNGAAGGTGSAYGVTPGQAGGAGPRSSIRGTSTRYGGGGGGGIYFSDGTRFEGGSGGGGGGGAAAIIEDNEMAAPATAGEPGTGGGGGAGTASYLNQSAGDGTGYRLPGAAGGSGVVIVRYALPA